MALPDSNVDLLTPWGLRHMDPDDPAEVQSDNPFSASTQPEIPINWPVIQERLPDAPLLAAWAAGDAIFEIAPGNCPVLHSLPRNRHGHFLVKPWAHASPLQDIDAWLDRTLEHVEVRRDWSSESLQSGASATQQSSPGQRPAAIVSPSFR